jgi:hypothetical protein
MVCPLLEWVSATPDDKAFISPNTIRHIGMVSFEQHFGSVVQFQYHIAEDTDIEVHAIGRVHARVIGFHGLQ